MAIEKLSYNGDSKVIKHICTVINAIIDSGGGGGSTASSVSYDNTVSGLTATDVQDAIDEVVADIPTDFVPASTGGTFSGNVTVDAGSGNSTYFKVGGASSKGNAEIYNSAGKYISIRYDDNATHNRNVVFRDVKDGIVAYTNVYNSFTENQRINRADGTSSTVGNSDFYLGNDTASGTDGNSRGRIIMYGSGTKYTVLETVVSGTNKTIDFPDASGTVALMEDIKFSNFQTLSNGVQYAKTGNLLMLRGSFGTAITVSGSLNLGTLPSGYRPSVKQFIPCGAELDMAIITIETNGSVKLETARTSAFYLALNTIIAL